MTDDRLVPAFITREIVELVLFVAWVIFLIWASAVALDLRTDPLFYLAMGLRFLVLPISLVWFAYYTARRTLAFVRRLNQNLPGERSS